MKACKYCTHIADKPGVLNSGRWLAAEWICTHGKTLSDLPTDCASFSREPGSDDDLGESLPTNSRQTAQQAITAAKAILASKHSGHKNKSLYGRERG
jgi:hypothetical protein